jgi:HNH endonuclease
LEAAMNTPCMFTKHKPRKNGRNGLQARQRIGRKHYLVHRLAWEKAFGPIPPGMKVCHHCDVGHCVNPEHLFLGPQRINVEDMMNKGRHAARLTWIEVILIRLGYLVGIPQDVLAKRFSIAQSMVSFIVRYKRWRETPEMQTFSSILNREFKQEAAESI